MTGIVLHRDGNQYQVGADRNRVELVACVHCLGGCAARGNGVYRRHRGGSARYVGIAFGGRLFRRRLWSGGRKVRGKGLHRPGGGGRVGNILRTLLILRWILCERARKHQCGRENKRSSSKTAWNHRTQSLILLRQATVHLLGCSNPMGWCI